MKVSFTLDDIKIKSNLVFNQTVILTKKSFFYTKLEVIQSHSGPLGDIDGFIQLKGGTFKKEKPINIIGIDKIILKCGCINGSIVNGIREPILYSFALS